MGGMIYEANTDALILRCFPVMRELRPHINTPQELLACVRRQIGTTDSRVLNFEIKQGADAHGGHRH